MVKGKDLSDLSTLNIKPNTVPGTANANDPEIRGKALMDLSKNLGANSQLLQYRNNSELGSIDKKSKPSFSKDRNVSSLIQ